MDTCGRLCAKSTISPVECNGESISTFEYQRSHVVSRYFLTWIWYFLVSGGSSRRCEGDAPTCGPNFLLFHAVFGKIGQKKKLAPPLGVGFSLANPGSVTARSIYWKFFAETNVSLIDMGINGFWFWASLFPTGEWNRNNSDDYDCALSNMVADWREAWYAESGTTMDRIFPFGQVQVTTRKIFFNNSRLGKCWFYSLPVKNRWHKFSTSWYRCYLH